MYSLNKSKFLLEPELAALTATLKKLRESSPRDVLLIELSLATGARATEILSIELKDLDTHEKTVFIKGLKGSLDREIPLPSELFERLVKFAGSPDAHARYRYASGSSEKSGRIFPISYNYFRKIWVNYRPVAKKLHCLRHTFALNLYRNTKDLKLVQQALGHKSIRNTEIYLNFDYSAKEMRRILIQEEAI